MESYLTEKERKFKELINTVFFIALAGSLFAHAPDFEKMGIDTLGVKGFGIVAYFGSLICSTIFTLRLLSGIRKRNGWNETEAKKEQSTIEDCEN